MSTFHFMVTAEVRRESGKFASRDEVAEAITEALEEANYGQLDGLGADGDSIYVIEDWSVDGGAV